jgi:hypothetical protein
MNADCSTNITIPQVKVADLGLHMSIGMPGAAGQGTKFYKSPKQAVCEDSAYVVSAAAHAYILSVILMTPTGGQSQYDHSSFRTIGKRMWLPELRMQA